MTITKKLLSSLAVFGIVFGGCGAASTVTAPESTTQAATAQIHHTDFEPNGSREGASSLGHVPTSQTGVKSTSTTRVAAALAQVKLPEEPSGPSTPAGYWRKPILADGFAAPIGTGVGEDNLWFASSGKGHNSNELQTFNPNQVSVGAEGLDLKLTYCAGCSESYGTKKNWYGGQVETLFSGSTPPSSHPNLFEWTPGLGDVWAFQFVAKIPPNNEALDPAWWSTDVPWTEEVDFTEWWGWNHPEYYFGMPVWVKASPYITHEGYKAKTEIPNPETSFHTYTYVIKGNSSTEVYIDGKFRWSTSATTPNKPKMGLILQDAMRVKEPSSHSQIDTYIRSVEVWNNTGKNYVGGGTAPGTSVGTTTPPPVEEEKTTTTTKTEETPPPVTKPATPTNCTATAHDEGETAWVEIKANPVSGAEKYVLWRLPLEAGAAESKAWTSSTTPTFANHKEVVKGHRYAYWIAAENLAGQSSTCVAGVFHA
jgi:hypothetical protein